MTQPLWVPSEQRRRGSNLTKFLGQVNGRYHRRLESYPQLWEWSVERIPEFWAAVGGVAGGAAELRGDPPRARGERAAGVALQGRDRAVVGDDVRGAPRRGRAPG